MTDSPRGDPGALTVTQLTQQIKQLLEAELPRVLVEGEISNYKHHSSGHMYFSLKDAGAQLRCVMFRHQAGRLSFRPEEGQKVQARGRISVFERSGQYQLYVSSMEPAGRGDLYQAFERLKARLEQEGLFDPSRKRSIPALPTTIGLITSPTGAAIRDMIRVLRTRAPTVEVVLHPVRVQGEEAAAEVAGAIRWFNRERPVDLLIVGRGGGSIEDLWAFNEEEVARAVHASAVPVISAVGHETDFTICDFVADYRAATPSNAAERAVPETAELLERVEAAGRAVRQLAASRIEQSRLRLQSIRRSELFRPDRRVEQLSESVDRMTQRIIELAGSEQERRGQAVADLGGRLRAAATGRFEKALGELRVIRARLEGLDPEAVLRRGYSLCYRVKDGRIIRSYRDVTDRSRIRVQLSEGGLEAQVTGREFL